MEPQPAGFPSVDMLDLSMAIRFQPADSGKKVVVYQPSPLCR